MSWVVVLLFVTSIASFASPQTDEHPPIIQDLKVHVIGETWFTVSWTTDEPALGGVEWGRDQDFGQVHHEEGDIPSTEHHMNVTGLTRGTLYFVRIFATDESNNTGYSETWQLGTFPVGMEERTLEQWGWYIATVVVLSSMIAGLALWNHLRDRGDPQRTGPMALSVRSTYRWKREP